ncbi:hypothetical protein [Helicobacter typhlonius]|uniref:Uncharacterized protein n=1 Tax=Helicobacter typhlonius TaxID=76936 RepID=A0A099UHE8_9HELI|nr:hypothetical protein [Helicobacter typhlonius]TLD79448.1 hypothetical protein LS75_000455 [Helicobacter typhlonius]CUU39451.1 Hypothetical protein BN2458_PEG0565 [Helicobacter typhlonius]
MKLGNKGMKILKTFHLINVIMWIGGVISLVTLQLGITPDLKETMYVERVDLINFHLKPNAKRSKTLKINQK